MFELSVALKYLIPRRKQLSVSLIALLSVVVISLVVWLVLVFLSVTEGIERGWLQKLTTLNAPLRVYPTQHYYSSYYYQADSLSGSSDYTTKNIAEKAGAKSSNPYNPLEDGELPFGFPRPDLSDEGALIDPVKGLYAVLGGRSDLVFQDFELSGALMRLQLLRPGNGMPGNESQGYLTQVSYLASLPDQCPELSSLLLPPREKDLDHLLYLASHATELSRQDSPTLTLKAPKETARSRIQELLQHIKIKEVKPRTQFWQIPATFLPLDQAFEAVVHERNGSVSRIDLPLEKGGVKRSKVWRKNTGLIIEDETRKQRQLSLNTPLLIDGPIVFHVEGVSENDSLLFNVRSSLQGTAFKGAVNIEEMQIVQAESEMPKLLPANEEKETGVLLAKSFLDNGVMIGDRGYLSYASTTSSAVQEHRLPIFVSGFYDPGILSVGNKCILVPPFVTRTINASTTSFNLDKLQSNGVLVWFDDLF